jgi:magnesium-transporting ATPase (P-type)
VIRGGEERQVPAEELVPGDLILLREGDRVPADARLTSTRGLAVDESALTGESIPADKGIEPIADGAGLAERSSTVFAGTGVTRGRARALVTATGPQAEIGRVAELTRRSKPPPTPLQRRLGTLSRLMVGAGVLITVGLAGIRLLQGASAEDAFLLGVSVAVAAVPEGLAATVTVALALGARRMAARGVIVRRLVAVETLGSATIVATDKTGTLTQNRLRVQALAPSGLHDEKEVLEAAVLASTAELVERDGELEVAGDPVEGALLLAARKNGISPAALRRGRRLVLELPFEADSRRMTLAWEESGTVHAFTKGAPEVVLARCGGSGAERRRLRALADDWAGRGLRVLALAKRSVGSTGDLRDAEVDRDLEPLGLVALHDPLRSTAAGAVRSAREAGLSVHLLTGDHPATAAAIARELELPDDAVSARVTPRDKLRLVEALQGEGEVVAVTGDGVNDAPPYGARTSE